MPKLFLSFLFLITTTAAHSLTIKILCPDGNAMRQGTWCAPDWPCHPDGLRIKSENKSFKANIIDGKISISDDYLGKEISLNSGENFWYPSYCENFRSGSFFAHVVATKDQTITMNYLPR